MSKKIISILASFALVLSMAVATTASALTAADISMLQAAGIINATQAASLSASIAAPVATASSYTFTKSLTIGSTGADVTALQQVLVSQGDLVMPAGTAFGYFGNLTKTALAKYQAAMGISPAVGYFGPITMAKVNASAGSVTTTGGTTVVATGSSLNFALAATSPSAGSIISGQAAADLAEYTFTNTSATPAVVTNVTLQRGGVSADTSLANVYLFQGAVRLTDAATVSSGKITFNSGTGLFTVAPGQSVTIAVKADILYATGNASISGQTVNVALTSVTASIPGSGVYPITGSTFTVATAGDLAGVTLVANTITTSVDAGTLQDTIWSAALTQTNRAVYLKSAAFKIIGSIPQNSLANIGLFISGVQVATASGIDNNGMITFDLTSNPYKIDSSRTVEVRADIVNGANRSFSVDLQNAADFQIVDSNYNVGITAIGIPMSESTINVNTGSLSVSLDSTLSSGNVVLGSTNVDLAKYTLRSYGEDEKISYLDVASNYALQNVTLYVNGASISSSANVATTSDSTTGVPTMSGTPQMTQFSLGSSLIIPAGQTVSLDIKGDLKDLSGNNIPAGSQVIVSLVGVQNNAQGSYSDSLVTFPGTTANGVSSPSYVVGPTMSVVGAGLTVGANAAYNNITLTPNTTSFKIGSYILSANSSEAIRVTGMTVGIPTETDTLGLTNLSNLYVVAAGVNSSRVNPQISNNFGTNFTVPANSSQEVDVYADIGAIPTTPTTSYGTATFTLPSEITATTTINNFFIGSTIASASQTGIAAALVNAINGTAGVGVSAATTTTAGQVLLTNTGSVQITATTTSATAGATTTTSANASVTLSSAALQTNLSVTANGVTSNADASVNSAKNGQVLTVGNGSLNAPVLSTSGLTTQTLVVGGTTAFPIATFNFTSSVGASTITDLGFNLNPANSQDITSITVGGVTQTVTVGSATTTISGLNIQVPTGNVGTDVPVTVAYNTMGTSSGGILSGQAVDLSLVYAKYISGNATKYLGVANAMNVAAATTTPVAAYPSFSVLNSGTIGALSAGQGKFLGSIVVNVVGNNPIYLNKLPVIIDTSTNASIATGALQLEVGGVVEATTTTPVNNAINELVFTTPYKVTSSTQFDLYGTVSGSLASTNGDSITTYLGTTTPSALQWNDIQGGATGLDATLIPVNSYPVNSYYELHN